MAYDENYYKDKQIKVTNKLVKKMEETLAGIAQSLNVYFADKDDLVKDLTEITGIIKNKGELPKSKQEIAKDAIKEVSEPKPAPVEAPKEVPPVTPPVTPPAQ